MDLYQQAQALVDDNRLTAVISAVVTMLSLLPKLLSPLFKTLQTHSWQPVRKTFEQADAETECNTVIELKPEHHAA